VMGRVPDGAAWLMRFLTPKSTATRTARSRSEFFVATPFGCALLGCRLERSISAETEVVSEDAEIG
jgi:hypothetical protein